MPVAEERTSNSREQKKSSTKFTVIINKMPATVTKAENETMNTSGVKGNVSMDASGFLNTSNLSRYYRRNDLTREKVKEYVWSVKLTAEEPSATWSFEEEDNDEDFLMHTLFLRHVTLGVVKDDSSVKRNLVMCTTKNWEGEEITFPVASLSLGNQDMANLDLNFHPDTAVTFQLVQGSGPVHIVGQHMVEFPSDEEDEYQEYTEESETEAEDKEVKDVREVLLAKRKASNALLRKGKKGKLDDSALSEGNDDEEDDSDEEEAEEEEEDEEVSGEEEDEDDDDEEAEEDDEEEEEEDEEDMDEDEVDLEEEEKKEEEKKAASKKKLDTKKSVKAKSSNGDAKKSVKKVVKSISAKSSPASVKKTKKVTDKKKSKKSM